MWKQQKERKSSYSGTELRAFCVLDTCSTTELTLSIEGKHFSGGTHTEIRRCTVPIHDRGRWAVGSVTQSALWEQMRLLLSFQSSSTKTAPQKSGLIWQPDRIQHKACIITGLKEVECVLSISAQWTLLKQIKILVGKAETKYLKMTESPKQLEHFSMTGPIFLLQLCNL